MADFASFVRREVPTSPALPLFHSTDGYSFRDILRSRLLSLAPCGVYGEPLLYLFYGRPFYRVNPSSEPSRIRASLPVCFVLSPDVADKCKRVLPFDSGAFQAGLFSKFMSPKMKKSDFELDPVFESAQKIVTAFYDSNRSYFRGDGKATVKIPSMEFEAEAYHHLVRSYAQDAFDDRCAAVEIQLEREVPLTADSVKAVILPESFLDDHSIRATLEVEWDTCVLTYDYSRMKPIEYTSEVARLASELLTTSGLI